MGLLYGLGASIVIIGALFKIEHWPGASAMLIIGLGTEALIFAVSAFEPPHSEVDWTLAYPELAGLEEDQLSAAAKKTKSGDSVSQEMDRMLEEAKIGPELIESLGTGFRNLSDHTAKLNNISDASVATDEFVGNIKDASTNSKLSELNNVYELQLKSASEHMQASNQAFEGMDNLMTNLRSSVEGTEQYKSNITELAQNLSSLNTIYGNMLNAMNAGMAPRNNS